MECTKKRAKKESPCNSYAASKRTPNSGLNIYIYIYIRLLKAMCQTAQCIIRYNTI